jgi:aryl-alcohol dehydrogenase-like predicted oxidoreductase
MAISQIAASGTFTLGANTTDPLTVRRLGFGAMRITGAGIWGDPPDHDVAIKVLRRAVELGVDFIDTADSYGPYVSEDLIREALYPYNNVVIATKGALTRQGPDKWEAVGAPAYLRQCVQMSLRRLGVESIDLWQLHRIDPKVPADDQFGVMKEMQDEGLIRHIGLSEVSVSELLGAQKFFNVVSVQNLYNASNRASEELLTHCEANQIGFIPWFPLGNRELVATDGPLAGIATRLGCTPAQVALAWLLQHSPVMLPIPGTGSIAHLDENCGGASVQLDELAISEINDLGKDLV